MRGGSAGSHRLGLTTSPAAGQAAGAPVLIPTGSFEQHGPHLPLGTDTLIAEAVAEATATAADGALVAEPIAYGCSWHHMRMPGTASLHAETFIAIAAEVAASLCSHGYVPIFVNGHGGNRAPLDVALIRLAESGHRCAAFTYFELLEDVVREEFDDPGSATGHACALETSLVLFLWPELVDTSAVPPGETPLTWPDPHMFVTSKASLARRFDEINPTGVIGRPAAASADAGRRLFEAAVERSIDLVSRLTAELKSSSRLAARAFDRSPHPA